MELGDNIEMASEEITSDNKVDIIMGNTETKSSLLEDEAPTPVAKQPEQVQSNATAASGKPASVRPAPLPYGGAASKSRTETSKFSRKGKRKVDSGQGTSATKKSKG